MRPRTFPIWLCVLLLCALSGGPLLAQDGEATPLLFEGTLNDGSDVEGNNAVFTVTFNAGDQVTATALCEMSADGLRSIDPALTVYAPQGENSLERLQWYNDDSEIVSDCVDYRSSQIIFEAPSTGEYEFLIENLANRSGPFSLEILGSTAIQVGQDFAPPGATEDTLVETGAEDIDLVALETPAEGLDEVGITFIGTLAAKDEAALAWQGFAVNINAGDEVRAELTCEESFGGRWLDPSLRVSFTDADGDVSSWENDDHEQATLCNAYRSSYIELTAPEDGVYTFRANNLSYFKGDFSLQINGVSAEQVALDETITPLWDGSSEPSGALTYIEGTLAAREEIGHNVMMEAGMQVAALATCDAVDDLRPMDPLLRVLNPEGEQILYIDDSASYQACSSWYSSYGEFIADASGEYTFIVRNLSREGSGPYTLTLLQTGLIVGAPDAKASAVLGASGGGPSVVSSSDDARVGALGEIGVVFLVDTERGPRLDIYAVDSLSAGQHVLSIYGDQLTSTPNGELLLASAWGGSYSAYHRSDGSLRLSAGPNPEGKRYHMIVSGIPGNVLATYDEIIAASASAASAISADAAEPTVNIIATHIVQPGETLYSIGVRYGVGYEAIAAVNGIDSSFIIHIGAELQIPAP